MEPLSKPSFRTMAFDVSRLANPASAFGCNVSAELSAGKEYCVDAYQRRVLFLQCVARAGLHGPLSMKREEVPMNVWLSIFALAALAIGVSSPGSAHQVVVGKLKIGHPWVREAAEGAPGTCSCIIEIQNDGDEPQRLLGAIIEGAGTGVLYKLTENNGHFTSRPFQEGLVIKPHGSVELPPTAYQSAKSEIR